MKSGNMYDVDFLVYDSVIKNNLLMNGRNKQMKARVVGGTPEDAEKFIRQKYGSSLVAILQISEQSAEDNK